MATEVGTLESQVDVVDGNSLLSKPNMEKIVQAVMTELQKQGKLDAIKKTNLDMRSIVDQQGRGGADG